MIPPVILLPFFLSALSAFLISRFGSKISLIDNPTERSSHSFPTPRGGGIGIWLSFIIIGIFFIGDIRFSAVAFAGGLLGLIEDRYILSSMSRLFIQFVISASAIYMFLGLPTYGMFVLLSLFWMIFMTGTANFYNFMDGVDGIAGVSSVVGFGLMAFFSFYIAADLDVAWMSITIAAACSGFLLFNFPKAKVFMGDVGSIFLGFLFAAFVMKQSTNINIFLCLTMFLCTFYADAIVTIFYRWKRGEKLTVAHRYHLYQYLSNELGLPHWIVTVIYAVVQLAFGSVAIFAYCKGLNWQVGIFLTFNTLFLVSYRIIKNKVPLTSEFAYRKNK